MSYHYAVIPVTCKTRTIQLTEIEIKKLREECGVFGIYGHAEAARLTYLGLYALQHRGQESCGIVASDGRQLVFERAMGHVSESFDQARLDRLTGQSSIGHVRYSTAGEVSIRECQPFVVTCQHGQIAICHNGNLPFAGEDRKKLEKEGAIFSSTSDTEVVLHEVARSRLAQGVDGSRPLAPGERFGSHSRSPARNRRRFLDALSDAERPDRDSRPAWLSTA